MEAGFVGLGSMGRGMARNVLKAGHRLTVWNRTRAKSDDLAREGAAIAGTPAEAARCGVVVTMVADDAALDDVTLGKDGILAGLPRGGLHVSMSTVGDDTTERLVRAHADAGATMLAAPVFGRPDAAAAAKLFIVAAGPEHAIERARPLLDAMGQRSFVLGTDPASASVVKLAGNFLITAMIEGLAEAATLVGRAGVDRSRFMEVMTESLFNVPVYRSYGRTIVEERFSPPGFALPLGLKDNRLLLHAGERLAVPLPLASLIRDRMLAAMAKGYRDQDWTSFARIVADQAGLAPAGDPQSR